MKLNLAVPLGVLGVAPSVLAWGVVGHEVVATIAQIHLHDSTLVAVKSLLPTSARGHLAPVAAWADRVRNIFHWSGVLHYVNAIDDYPSDTCVFDHGFKDEDHNVIKAIGNYTRRLMDNPEDYDLRFLTHYLGDVHQPLHLTGRDKGGNDDPVYFEHKKISLHGIWDTQMISRSLRELTNYTRSTNIPQIEQNLRGAIYDGYIRWIILEGISQWWSDDIESWLLCPNAPAPAIKTKSTTTKPRILELFTLWRHVMSFLDNENRRQKTFIGRRSESGSEEEVLICPDHWASETHEITCTYPFPPSYDKSGPYPELGGSNYYGRVRNDKILESLLAKAGIRLASILNAIFSSEDDLMKHGSINLQYRGGFDQV